MSYALTSTLAGLLALVALLLYVVSVADTNRTLNVQAWFAWLPVLLVVLVADGRPGALSVQARRWHAFVRQVGLLVVAVQAIGFAVWAIVEWTQAPAESGDDLLDEPRNFFGLVIATLFSLAGVALFAFYCALAAANTNAA